MTEIVSFGEWVQTRRNQLRYSRKAFAELMSCAPVTIKKIERDERRPSEEMAQLLATHLQIPQDGQEDFVRRARGEFVARLTSPQEMSLAEAQIPDVDEEKAKHNLPPQVTPFFGRQAELDQITSHLAEPSCRLLTILGAGGMGKTRLSIECARAQITNYTDGVLFAPLASIYPREDSNREASTNRFAQGLIDALQITVHGRRAPEQQLLNYLQRKEVLIVFDNCEHLLDDIEYLSDILTYAADVKIMATSRERLNLQEEWLVSLSGLTYASTEEKSAVQLFNQRAKQVKADFDSEGERDAVLRICELVEGMPLGLELAAAWVRQMSSEAIAAGIASELQFLSTKLRNVPERHRSLQGVFNQTYQGLNASERMTLKKLVVVQNGFDHEAAIGIAGTSLFELSNLCDKSLLSVSDEGAYSIHPLLRQFAFHELNQDQQLKLEATRAHALYFLNRANETALSQHVNRAVGQHVDHTYGENEYLRELDYVTKNFENLHSAFLWGVQHQLDFFDLHFQGVLFHLFEIPGRYLNGASFFQRLSDRLYLELESSGSQDQELVKETLMAHHALALSNLAWFKMRQFRLSEAEKILQDGEHYLVNDKRNLFNIIKGWFLYIEAHIALFKGNFGRAKHLALESARFSKENIVANMLAFHAITLSLILSGEFAQASKLIDEKLPIFDQSNLPALRPLFLTHKGTYEANRGNLEVAKHYFQESLEAHKKYRHNIDVIYSYLKLGHVARLQGNLEEARDLILKSNALALEINTSPAQGIWSLGNLAMAEGDYSTAMRYFEASGLMSQGRRGLGWAALGLGNLNDAESHFLANIGSMLKSDAKPRGLDGITGITHVLAQLNQFERSIELLTLVLNHPSTVFETHQKAAQLRRKLDPELSPELITQAETRGRQLDLFKTAEFLLT